jgi:hypothetical protein
MNFIKRTGLIDSLALGCLVCVLIQPLFRLKYLDNWPSIEGTFITDARTLNERLPSSFLRPGWQPLWYCGTRADYIYPPALRYGIVLISRVGHVIPARAYHLYIAFFYVFGIVAVYWLVRIGSSSRGSAFLASAATALLSPSFLLLSGYRHDSVFWVPQRLHVLMAYGEGPHISALSILPAALAASFLAVRSWKPAALAAAGALGALVAANNFYGATALAILYPIVVWSVWACERPRGVWLRAAAIPVLAYGLSAFWLTPSYVKITLMDLKWVSLPANNSSRVVLLIAAAYYCLFTVRAASRRPDREWAVFVSGAALIFSVWVLGFFGFGLRISGDSVRFLPELDLALILVSVEAVRRLWADPRLRLPVALLVMFAFVPALRYLKHAWTPFPKAAPLENVYEYKTAKWVNDHLPGARVLPAGTVRFWFDAWFDNAQPDGASDQAMLDQIIPTATWEIFQGDRADLTVLWLQALGTDAVVAPGPGSFEPYHELKHPEKLSGVLPILYDDQHETLIYRVPRLHPGIARIVDRAAMNSPVKIQGGDDAAGLAKYVAVVENPAQNASTLTWHGFDEADIEAHTGEGQSVLVQETWDPAWHAYEHDKELPIRIETAMGFMLIDTPEGEHRIQMRFETPLENRAGQVLFVLTGLVIGGLVIRR